MKAAPPPRRAHPDAVAAAMARAPFFSSLAEPSRTELRAEGRLVRLGPREILWREGEPARALGLVVSGRLKVVRRSARGETILDVAVAGDVLGEVALAAGSSYASEVASLRRAEVLRIPARSVRSLLHTRPGLAEALAADLAAQVIRLYRVADDLTAGSVEQRLARALLRLAERLGEPAPEGRLIAVRLRPSELATMAATTLESTSRRLSAWRRQGLLAKAPAGLLLVDPLRLEAIADPP